ncbi:uncharacterized protein LOC133186974 [Saccostrea echinata]|uniref:uncharacterized protein LOC133186974 n=1 Tax=Saccostrea echinata TaxID=191078 RepID=UPI002A830D97|nr:uncharacterized protein LOC133186974 [Saccostrea echinata]
MCFTQIKESKPKSKGKGPVASRKNTRDMKRLCKYLENKRILRELPFSSLRDSQFRSICDNSCVLRTELKNLKIQICNANKEKRSLTAELTKAESEIKKLQNQNMVMKKKMQEQSNNSNDNIYREKIRKLEDDAHGDRVIMDLMQRKLNEIGKEHNQYVMQIQAEAVKTTKQLREENKALLQTIRTLENEKDHLLALFVENKQRYQPRRHQGRPRRGQFY